MKVRFDSNREFQIQAIEAVVFQIEVCPQEG